MAKRKAAVCDFLSEETLEAYLLGRLPEDDPEVQRIEEHLLWCEVCQASAEASEKEIQALRAALQLAAGKPKPAKARAKAMAIHIS